MIASQVAAALGIAMGGDVVCRDGHAGHVHRLVVEPESRRVTDLVVEHGLRRLRVVVPIAQVAQVEVQVVRLALDGHQLAALPPYMAVDFARPDPAWTARHGIAVTDSTFSRQSCSPWGKIGGAESPNVLVRKHLHTGVPEHKVPVGPGTRVSCAAGPVGHLDRVLLDPTTYTIRALVARGGHFHTREVQLPAGPAMAFSEREIRTGADLPST